MLDPKRIYQKSIFAKCTRLACLLSFASLFLSAQQPRNSQPSPWSTLDSFLDKKYFFQTNFICCVESTGPKQNPTRWRALVTNFHGNARWETAEQLLEPKEEESTPVPRRNIDCAQFDLRREAFYNATLTLFSSVWLVWLQSRTSCRRSLRETKIGNLLHDRKLLRDQLSSPNLHQIQLSIMQPQSKRDKMVSVSEDDHDGTRRWLCKFSDEQKVCLLIEEHCRMWKTLQEIRPRLHGRGSYGRLSQGEMTLLCSPLSTYSSAHILKGRHIYHGVLKAHSTFLNS